MRSARRRRCSATSRWATPPATSPPPTPRCGPTPAPTAEVEVEEVDPLGPEARACLSRYFAELDERFAAGFDPDAALPTDARVFVVARLDGELVGCGALKVVEAATIEIKRMWVAPAARGRGVGRRLLADLEARAEALGARTIRLDTNGTLLEAIAMYRAAGYVEVAAFNAEPHATLWMARST